MKRRFLLPETTGTQVVVPRKAKPWSRNHHHHNEERVQSLAKGTVKSGRARAWLLLEGLLGKEKNLQVLDLALQAEFDKDPTKFIRTYVMPFVPKQTKLEVTRLPVEIRLVLPGTDEGRNPCIDLDPPG